MMPLVKLVDKRPYCFRWGINDDSTAELHSVRLVIIVQGCCDDIHIAVNCQVMSTYT